MAIPAYQICDGSGGVGPLEDCGRARCHAWRQLVGGDVGE